MTIFFFCTVIASVGSLLYLLQVYAARSLLHSDDSHKGESLPLPPISILKPLRGLDDNLFDNLAAFCLQDYPEYEVIFSLQDFNDPAYKVARKVQDRFPHRTISIVIERCDVGLNPKINNLIPAYRKSSYPFILISDSNVMVGSDYLREIMIRAQSPGVGLVYNLIRGVGGRSFGAKLENLHLNSFIIGSVSFLQRFLNMPCVIGKSMLMKKSNLESLGGLEAFKDILAEDFIIGREMKNAGKEVVLSNYLVSNVNAYWSVKRFLNRHTRWGQLRWQIGGYKYLLEILVNPIFVSVIPLLHNGPSWRAVSFATLVSSIKVLGDMLLHQSIRRRGGSSSCIEPSLLTFLMVPLKDILIGILWFAPMMTTSVVWRGNRYLIGKDSRLAPVPIKGFWSWRYRITDVIREKFA